MDRIKLDVDRVIAEVNPNIYGGFIEHLGRCIYGGIYDEDSKNTDSEKIRIDVLDAVRQLSIPNLRWPGGNFVSGYNWLDGIGPVASRPSKLNLAWNGVESNRFGTDEFIAFCRKLKTEPYICVNMGTGTMEEAAGWVEYCNGTENTYYAGLRRKNGNEDPFSVKYWGLGNEVYGNWQIGHKGAGEYARQALEFGKMMKMVDRSIELIACGAGEPNWDRIILETLYGLVDYISIHIYLGLHQPMKGYNSMMEETVRFENQIKTLRAVIETVAAQRPKQQRPMIAVDEWNVWYRAMGDCQLEERYNLEDAVAVACCLNVFHRHADMITMANLAQLVNVIAPIFTGPEKLFLQTIYFPLLLYRRENGDKSLDLLVETGGYQSERVGWVSYLDTAATFDESTRTITLNVVNRHETESRMAAIEGQNGNFAPNVSSFTIYNDDVKVENSFDSSPVGIIEGKTEAEKNRLVYKFPPHSVTVLKLQLG